MKFIIITITVLISSCLFDKNNQRNLSPEKAVEEFFLENYLECTSFESQEECVEFENQNQAYTKDDLYIYMKATSLTVCQFEKDSNKLIYCECSPNLDRNSIEMNENTGLILMAYLENCDLGEISGVDLN